jgi:hypothetical protein
VVLDVEGVERLNQPITLAERGLARPPRSYAWLPPDQAYPAPPAAALDRLRVDR